MDIKYLGNHLAVTSQIDADDLVAIRDAGFRAVICNRPNGETLSQPSFDEISKEAASLGLETLYLPTDIGDPKNSEVERFRDALVSLPGPVLAYCTTGLRSARLWALAMATQMPVHEILAATKAAGFDMADEVRRIVNGGRIAAISAEAPYDVLIVGGGSAGIAVAASLMRRMPDSDVGLIDPADAHYFQSAWTMVGAGIFKPDRTARTMGGLIPKGVEWIKNAVVAFEPASNALVLDSGRVVTYKRLIVCPGLKLDWGQIDGLERTLGKNGVTSNYRYDLASYTSKLVKQMRHGTAIFTQPKSPIKCAGAPQKAVYLSSDYWLRRNRLGAIDVKFMTAGKHLFGVKDFVPALERYIDKYDVDLNYEHNLVAVNGPRRTATFEVTSPDAEPYRITVNYNMIHVVPPQVSPDFVRVSALADKDGWIDVDPRTLRHKKFPNIWGLGDVINAPNSKTAAAAWAQAAVVAENVANNMDGKTTEVHYSGYSACPLMVERGKLVLAEFGYGGKLMPTLPSWLLNSKRPTRLAWWLWRKVMPTYYWKAALRGRELLTKPKTVASRN